MVTEPDAHHRCALRLDLLLSFCSDNGVIDSYSIERENIVVSTLGANYRTDCDHAVEVLLRLLSERPALASLARRTCTG